MLSRRVIDTVANFEVARLRRFSPAIFGDIGFRLVFYKTVVCISLIKLVGWAQMSNRVFPIFIALLFWLGIYSGWILASRPSFSIPAVLNVVGIVYSMIAVIVLYETIAQSQAFKKIIVSHLAPVLLWANTIIPLGVASSWFLIRKLPHGNQVGVFGFSFFVYSILPLAFMEATVTFPRIAKLMSLDGRHRRFGFFLLLSGLFMQLVAALCAL